LNSVPVRFPCEDITLEGELLLPAGNGPFPGVIVCHPHPQYGGNMLNNIVTAVYQILPTSSIAALRFNFRGVGNSEGGFGGGIGEQEDAKAALTFLRSTSDIDGGRIGLVGYSFGATAAFPVALRDEMVSLLALVSPYLSDPNWEQLKSYHRSKLLIVGDADFVLPLERFQQHMKDMAEPKESHIVSGADHFWGGYEGELAQKITDFFTTGFGLV